MKLLSEWNHADGLVDGTLPEEYINKFVTGETCAVVVGNPILSQNQSLDSLTVVGSAQQIQISQNKQVRFVWEMGSRRGSIVPGRASGTMAITKMMLHGPSVLKALYSYITEEELDALYQRPGYGEFWLNLNSELFNRPTGIGLIMRDNEASQFGSFFFEACYIASHQFAVGAQTMVIGENIQTRFEAIKPLPIVGLQ